MSTTPTPELTIVVAARNEQAVLERCLTALHQQQTTIAFEVIVVDNGSNDRTGEIARRAGSIVVEEPIADQLRSKRRGVDMARGRLIAILDADCVPATTWIENLVQAFNHDTAKKISAVTCYYDYGTDLPRWGRVYCSIIRFWLWSFRTLRCSMPFVLGGNVAFRRSHLGEAGYPVQGGIGQTERGLAMQLRKLGTIHYCGGMRVESSARRFLAGPRHFFLEYKMRTYLAPWFRAIFGRLIDNREKSP